MLPYSVGFTMKELDDLSESDRAFLDSAIENCDALGGNAVLLLVGNRAAGFSCPNADLDLWIVGDKQFLSSELREAHDRDGSVFVDRGDFDAHWTFFDSDTLTEILSEWPDEKCWIVSTSAYIHGNFVTFDDLKTHFSSYPHEVASRKLKWLIGNCRVLFSSFPKSGQTKPIASLMVSGRIIECLFKMCCVADRIPIPYPKCSQRWQKEPGSEPQLSQ